MSSTQGGGRRKGSGSKRGGGTSKQQSSSSPKQASDKDKGGNNEPFSLVRNTSLGMAPRGILTGFYGSRGERLKHTVHNGALQMPKEALELINRTTKGTGIKQQKSEYELPGFDVVVRPCVDPTIDDFVITEISYERVAIPQQQQQQQIPNNSMGDELTQQQQQQQQQPTTMIYVDGTKVENRTRRRAFFDLYRASRMERIRGGGNVGTDDNDEKRKEDSNRMDVDEGPQQKEGPNVDAAAEEDSKMDVDPPAGKPNVELTGDVGGGEGAIEPAKPAVENTTTADESVAASKPPPPPTAEASTTEFLTAEDANKTEVRNEAPAALEDVSRPVEGEKMPSSTNGQSQQPSMPPAVPATSKAGPGLPPPPAPSSNNAPAPVVPTTMESASLSTPAPISSSSKNVPAEPATAATGTAPSPATEPTPTPATSTSGTAQTTNTSAGDPVPPAATTSTSTTATTTTQTQVSKVIADPPLPAAKGLATKPTAHWVQHQPGPNDEMVTPKDQLTPRPGWYNSDGVADIERTMLPEWFNSTSSHRTPNTYIEAREKIISISDTISNRNVTNAMVRRYVVGDSGSLHRLRQFLVNFGLINEDGINDSSPTHQVLRENKPAPPPQAFDDNLKEDLLGAVIDQSKKMKKRRYNEISGDDDETSGFTPINWEEVATQVGRGVTSAQCELNFLSLQLDGVNSSAAERSITPDCTNEMPAATKSSSIEGEKDAASKNVAQVKIRKELMKSMIETANPDVVNKVLTTSFEAAGGNMKEAQTAALVGLSAAKAIEEARNDEAELSSVLSQLVDQRMKKLENRMALLDDIEGIMEAERIALELERRDLYTARCRHWFGGA